VIFITDNKVGTNPGGGFLANLESAFNLPGATGGTASTGVNTNSLGLGSLEQQLTPGLNAFSLNVLGQSASSGTPAQ
jgi:hypothetical protein